MLSCHSLCTWNEPLWLCWTLEKSCIFLYLYNQKKESRRWLLGMREAVVLWFDGEWSLQTYYALTQAQISALTKPTEQYVLGIGSRVLWHPGTRRPGLLGRASCNPACREIWVSQHIRVEEILIQGHPHPTAAGGLKHCAWSQSWRQGSGRRADERGREEKHKIDQCHSVLPWRLQTRTYPNLFQRTTGISRVAHPEIEVEAEEKNRTVVQSVGELQGPLP